MQATEFILQTDVDCVGVLSDSRSSLELIRDRSTLHPLAFAIRQSLAKLHGKGCEVRLYWVKAHVGNPGNERADELAKQAASDTEATVQYDRCPLSRVKQIIRYETQNLWDQRYRNGTTAQVTKMFFPSIYEAYKIIKTINIKPALTQIMTGHGGFSAYLYRFKLKDKPECKCGMGDDETVQHLLFECQIYEGIRCGLETAIKMKVTEATLAGIIADKETRPYLIEYCTRVAEIAVKENRNR